MPLIVAPLMMVLWANGASAHGPAIVTPDALLYSWSFDPLVLIPLLVFHWLYGRGVLRLWTRAGFGRGVSAARVGAFAAGELALFVALVSPIDQLGGTLLSAHMAQHALLVAVAPPLLLLGRPGAVFSWAFGSAQRKRLFSFAPWRRLAALGNALSRPVPAAVSHGIALWLWHAPALFDAAIENEWVHKLEHAMFFGTALLFWRAVLDARPSHRAAPALGASFSTLVHGGLLGALITLAPYPLYAAYAGRAEIWNLETLQDQQLAGLLMWVPMGLVYLGACLLLAARISGVAATDLREQSLVAPVGQGGPE